MIRRHSDIVLAVNVTAAEIEDPLFIKDIVQAVREAQFPPSRLELEITESVAMRNPDLVCERISLLRQLGIRFAIDDFGAGYSNLATMARLALRYGQARPLARRRRRAQDPEKQSILRIAIGSRRSSDSRPWRKASNPGRSAFRRRERRDHGARLRAEPRAHLGTALGPV